MSHTNDFSSTSAPNVKTSQSLHVIGSVHCGTEVVENSQSQSRFGSVQYYCNICRLPENSDLLHPLFLTDNEALSLVGNSYTVIPENLMFKKGTNKTKKIIQELISNDPRSKIQQI